MDQNVLYFHEEKQSYAPLAKLGTILKYQITKILGDIHQSVTSRFQEFSVF